jgi:hypothetical protein
METVLKKCPGCDGERLIPVATIEGTNFFCRDCVSCWHLEHGRTYVVDPQDCPGCQLGTTACFERWGIPPKGHHHGLGWGDIESELYRSAREACCFAFSGD